MYLLVPLILVWVSLALVLLLRWVIRAIWRRVRPVPPASIVIRGRGLNGYYAAVLVLSVVIPIVSAAYSDSRPRGSRPHGLFMIALYASGLLLFIAGQIRSHKFSRANALLVPVIFVALGFAVGLLWLLNFAGNFGL